MPPDFIIPLSEQNQQVELYGALKATGQVGAVRYGVLGASEDDLVFEVEDRRIPQSGSDYAVGRVLWEDSRFGGYRAVGAISTMTAHPDEDAVVHGVDYHYLTANGAWKVDGQFLYSDKDSVGEGFGGFADVVYTPRRGLKLDLELSHYDDKLDINDLGFLQRNDITRVGFTVDYTNPTVSWARQLELRGTTAYEVNGDGDTTRQGFATSADVDLHNLGRIESSVILFGRRTDDLESFGNGSFTIPNRWETDVDYFSDPARRFSYRVGFDVDEEKVDGLAYKARLGFTWRPLDRMKLEVLTEYVLRDGWLLHQEDEHFTTFETEEWRPSLSLDFFFSARQQLRLTAQWIGIKAEEDAFLSDPGRRRRADCGSETAWSERRLRHLQSRTTVSLSMGDCALVRPLFRVHVERAKNGNRCEFLRAVRCGVE